MREEGDVLWGLFPRSDGERGAHPALLVARLGVTYVAIVGTTKRVGRVSVGGQLVVTPDDVAPCVWQATGLKTRTGFDFKSGLLAILGDAPRYGEFRIGSIAQGASWKRTMRDHLPILVQRIRSELARRA